MAKVKTGRPAKVNKEQIAQIRALYKEYRAARRLWKSLSPAVMCKKFGLTEVAYRRYLNGKAKG